MGSPGGFPRGKSLEFPRRVSPKRRVPSGQDPQGHVPKAGGPKGPGPSRTGPQSLCPQSGGPKGPRARSLKSPSPERPPPQLASLNPWSPKPPQSRDPIFHVPQAQELPRHRAAQDTPRPRWERGQKGAVTGRATPGDTVCATNLCGGLPPSLWCPRGPRAGGTWIWGSGHILAG